MHKLPQEERRALEEHIKEKAEKQVKQITSKRSLERRLQCQSMAEDGIQSVTVGPEVSITRRVSGRAKKKKKKKKKNQS